MQGDWQRTIAIESGKAASIALTPDESFHVVVDINNHQVAMLQATDGTYVRQLTGPPDTLQMPLCVAFVPSTGKVLVSNAYRHQVERFQSIDDMPVIGTLGTGEGSGPTQLNRPTGLAVLVDANET